MRGLPVAWPLPPVLHGRLPGSSRRLSSPVSAPTSHSHCPRSNFINVRSVHVDCDGDSLIYLGVPDGPSCHTARETGPARITVDTSADTTANSPPLCESTLCTRLAGRRHVLFRAARG